MFSAGFADVPAAGGGAGTTPAPTTIDSGAGAAGGFNTGCGIGQAAGALCTALGSIYVASIQGETLDRQMAAMEEGFASQQRMVAKDTTMKVEMAQAGEDKIKAQQAGQKELYKAQEGRAKVDGQLSLVKEQKRQTELTEKSGQLNDNRNLSKYFPNSYSYGSPYA